MAIQFFVVPGFVHARQPAPTVTITEMIIAAATTATRPTALFFTIHNPGLDAVTITAVTTPACGRTELHDHIREGEVMRMREIPAIPVPAGARVQLRPLSLHIMCFDPVLPHVPGDTVPVTFTLADGGRIDHAAKIVTLEQAHAAFKKN
jgi:hypothetical protein